MAAAGVNDFDDIQCQTFYRHLAPTGQIGFANDIFLSEFAS
jgi:hypothetical protein